MMEPGTKIAHVKSENFISEAVDNFHVIALDMGTGPKISITASRDTIEIAQETIVTIPGGVRADALPEDVSIKRLVVANLVIPLEQARALAIGIQASIAQVEQAVQAHQAAQKI